MKQGPTLKKLLAKLPPDSEKAAMVKEALAQMTPAKQNVGISAAPVFSLDVTTNKHLLNK